MSIMSAPRFTTLEQWLQWQETLHPQAIDLGLERVRQVAQKLGLGKPAYPVITVGGTNGKGSCVAFLEAMLRAAGYRVGAYASPHLLRYNERIRVDGREVDDAALCRAFTAIDEARGSVSLTYFEFGTLAALMIFRDAGVQAGVLEVGLGGRLDAVNLVDADAALISSIAIDHVEWLGRDRDSIGREKAGIFRPGRPAICADLEPPPALLTQARALGARYYQAGRDYTWRCAAGQWSWRHADRRLEGLPAPALPGEHQFGNAAAALMALTALSERLPVPVAAFAQGLRQVRLAARLQIVPGIIEWILDVAHNPHAAAVLARYLQSRPCSGSTRAVLGMLSDKDAPGLARALNDVVDEWYVATLEGARGRSGEQLMNALRTGGVIRPIRPFVSIAAACRAACQEAVRGDRMLACGSFHTVAQAVGSDSFQAVLQAAKSRGFEFG